jgi:putative aldouronate transport system permease protein
MTVVSVVTVLPFMLLLMSSLTDNQSIIINGYSFFPKEWSFQAYMHIWEERAQIFRAYGISILVTSLGPTAGLLFSFFYAYVLSKPIFPGKRFFALFLLFTMLFNGGLVPTYIMYTQYLHIKNTLFALLIPNLMMNAFNVLLIRSYIQNNIPTALTEAAIIDGASEYTTAVRIVWPLAKPILITMGLFIGVAYWNDWTNGLYYVTNNQLYSVQQLLNNMLKNIEYLTRNSSSAKLSSNVAGSIPQATVRMAIAVVGILPILIIYPFVQRYFVRGISLGAVKG